MHFQTRTTLLLRTCFWLFLSLFFISFSLQAQTFERRYGQPGVREGGNCMLPLTNDTLVIGGFRADSALMLFVDPDGNVLRERVFKGTSVSQGRFDMLTDLKVDTDGMIFGSGIGRGISNPSAFVFRYNPVTDNLLWVREFTNSAGNISAAYTIHELGTNSPYLVTGQVNLGDERGYVLTLDRTTGMVIGTDQAYNLSGGEEAFTASILVPSGTSVIPRLFLTGQITHGSTADKERASLAEITVSGNQLWTRSYFVAPNPIARQSSTDLVHDNGSLVMASGGDRSGTSVGSITANLSGHSLAGALQWGAEYDFPNYPTEKFHEVVATGDGYVVYGDNRRVDVFLMKTDLNGVPLWAWEYAQDPSEAYGVPFFGQQQLIQHNNSFYFTGQVRPNGSNTTDVFLFRVDSTGMLSSTCQDSIFPATFPYTVENFTQMSNTSPLTNAVLNPSSAVPVSLPDTVFCKTDPPVGGGDCWAENDPNFTVIGAPITITDHQVWEGQVYVDDGVIVTVSGPNALLDMTNVDVVFGECAGIDFENGAHIRANNSVFRPCDTPDSLYAWRGLRFTTGAGGDIDESTFKRAQQAVEILGNGQADSMALRISGNHFVNNEWGIFVSGMRLSETISNNVFLIDDEVIDYDVANCMSPVYVFEHVGIHAINSTFEEIVSQNEFINASDPTGGKIFRGILAVLSSGTASFNHFSNNFAAIEMTSCNGFSVENNRIEMTQGATSAESQIRASAQSTWIWITGNHLINSNENNDFIADRAIFLEDCSIVNVKENEIDGFTVGIFSENVQNSGITENEIMNTNFTGIFQFNGAFQRISCNQIQPRFQQNTTNVGILYFKTDFAVESNEIRNNCVRNTSHAIALVNFNSSPMPAVTNNSLYNYTVAGVFNTNFTGGVGTGLAFNQAGRNTFVSNNIPGGTLDISSNVPITAAGNFGISSMSSTVTLTGDGLFNSTAACGHQIGTVSQQITADEVCDIFTANMQRLMAGFREDPASLLSWLEDEGFENPYRIAKAWLFKMVDEKDYDAAEKLLGSLEQSDLLRADEKALLAGAYALRTGADAQFILAMAGFEGETAGARALHQVMQVEFALRQSGRQYFEMTPTEIAALAAHSTKAFDHGDLAWEYLHAAQGAHPFRYTDREWPNLDVTGKAMHLEAENALQAFPNPVHDRLTVEYFVADPIEMELQLFDLQGRLRLTRTLDANGQQLDLDLSELGAGVYFLSLRGPEGRVSQQKILKM